MAYARPPASDRFLTKVQFVDKWYDDGVLRTRCLEWTGGKNSNGYIVNDDRRRLPVHRFAYERWVGQTPKGLQLDHLCRNRACVNPKHLEPVTSRVNTLRGVGITAQCASKTHCKNGHLLAGDNLLPRRGMRACRICDLEYRRNWMREYRRRKKQSGGRNHE